MSTTAPAIELTADQLRSFHERGWLLLPGLIEPELINGMRDALARHTAALLERLRDEGVIADTRADLPFETRFAVAAGAHAARFGPSWRSDIACAELYRLHHAPRLLDAVEQLLGEGVMGHAVWNARPKLPGQQLTVVPWHQDSGYFGAASASQCIVTAWVPLVEVSPRNGGLQIAEGSHRYGLVAHRPEDGTTGFLDIGAEPSPEVLVDLPMSPGDVLLFANLLWHRSLPNRSDGVRWSLDLRYYGESLAGRAGGDDFPEPWPVRAAQPAMTCERWLELARSMR